MEVGVYLNKEIEDVFDIMMRAADGARSGPMAGVPEPTRKKVAKIINALRERYANAPNYLEKVSLRADKLDADALAKVLGESFLGARKATRDGFEDFAKLFSNARESAGKKKFEPTEPGEIKAGQKVEHETFGTGTVTEIVPGRQGTRLAKIRFDSGDTRNIALEFKKLRVISAPGQVATEDVKSVAMALSEEMREVLKKVDHPVCRALVELAKKARPGANVLGIKRVDVDKERPELVRATFHDGKKSYIPVFNFLKQYLPGFDNLKLDEFVKQYTKVVNLASHEPGEVIKPRKFEFTPKDVRATFLSLVTETYPRGHEEEVVQYLGPGLKRDRHGNYYRVIGESDTMFASHLDTVSTKSKVTLVSRMKDNDEIISSDGTTILGADDKAGVTVMLYMMAHGVPGVYYFFVAEETGGIGSSKVAAEFSATPHLKGVTKCVSFDRKNYFSVITEQMYQECCSREFAEALCEQFRGLGLSMNPDPTGVFTDSANFIERVPECTNVSVGYFNEHSRSEALNVSFLARLARACVKVDWRALPVARGIQMDEDLYMYWGDLMYALDETGFANDLKVKGSGNSLTLMLSMDTTVFDDIYTDVQNLHYLLGKMGLDARVTFDFDLIKFEIAP